MNKLRPIKDRILVSLEPVLASPSHVAINSKKLAHAASGLLSEEIPAWDHTYQLLGTPEETAHYYFFVDSINFCFWGLKGEKRWEYEIEGEWMGGYYAYSRAIKDAFLRDRNLFDATYLSTISLDEFESIFQGRNKLLLLEERHRIIQENFSVLVRDFKGSALNLVVAAEKDVNGFAELLLAHFPSFRDQVEWNGNEVLFLKRVQILPSDLFFSGVDAFTFNNLDDLSVFADYKLPQLLEDLGVLKYSDELNDQIINEELIPAGSQKEIEIRASSIVATERLRQEMERQGREISSRELDWILWVKAKQTKFAKPHHKTLTTFY